jgi:hypothetical protein
LWLTVLAACVSDAPPAPAPLSSAALLRGALALAPQLPFSEDAALTVLESWELLAGPLCASSQHAGAQAFAVDFGGAEAEGVAVRAVAAGTVVVADGGFVSGAPGCTSPECNLGWGNAIVVDHGGGVFSTYAHLAAGSVAVSPGQAVCAGQALAQIGATGDAAGPHLHFQLQSGAALGAQSVPFDGFLGGVGVPACGETPPSPVSAGAGCATADTPCALAITASAPTVIDEQDACFVRSGPADGWFSAPGGQGGQMLHAPVQAAKSVEGTWRLEVAQSGTYAVEVYVPLVYATSAKAAYSVRHAGGATAKVAVDQADAAGTWVALGSFALAAGQTQWVRLADVTGEAPSPGLEIGWDAIRVLPVCPASPQPSCTAGGGVALFDLCGALLFDLEDCDDGDACTTDACTGGACVHGEVPGCCATSADCDDSDPCTKEVCVGGGCSVAPIAGCCAEQADCDDGELCTVDLCVSGACTFAPISGCCESAADCDDGVACTADSCVGHGCVHAPAGVCCISGLQCADGNPCTSDACKDGLCIHKVNSGCCDANADCDDGDPCTIDQCKAGTCALTPIPGCCGDAADCWDGNPCTAEACVSGACAFTSVAGCCQSDAACSDGNACTADLCLGHTCFVDKAPGCCTANFHCDDEDACTVDQCVGSACQHSPLPGCCHVPNDCADGDTCTKDLCQANTCAWQALPDCCAGPLDCDDGELCTADICEGGACAYVPIAGCCAHDADCDDGDPCTQTSCSGGGCKLSKVAGCCAKGAHCDDGVACTLDVCLPSGCANTPIPGCCESAADCDDGLTCTTDTCAAGLCAHSGVAGCCDSDADCTGGAPCEVGACTAGTCSYAAESGAQAVCFDGAVHGASSCGDLEGLLVPCGPCGCEDGACVEPDCAGKACGPDGCGGTCGACGPGETCGATGQCEPTDGCGGYDFEGACEGTALVWCEDDAVLSVDCAAKGLACAWVGGELGFACVPEVECPESCAGALCGAEGCPDACAACPGEMICKAGLCLDAADDPCAGIGAGGVCQGTSAVACEGGALESTDCAALGMVCADSDKAGGAVCVATCIPDCLGRACGSDGCGGSCGACGAPMTCDEGQCACPEGVAQSPFAGACADPDADSDAIPTVPPVVSGEPAGAGCRGVGGPSGGAAWVLCLLALLLGRIGRGLAIQGR